MLSGVVAIIEIPWKPSLEVARNSQQFQEEDMTVNGSIRWIEEATVRRQRRPEAKEVACQPVEHA